MLHDIWQAPTRAESDKPFDLFLDTFEAKHPRFVSGSLVDQDSFWCGWFVAQRAMQPDGVVMNSPAFDQDSCFQQRVAVLC